MVGARLIDPLFSMSHGIEATDRVIVRERQAWHGLAEVFEGPMRPDEALRRARLDWRVRTVPLYYARQDIVRQEAASDGRQQIVRCGRTFGEPDVGLATAGNGWTPLQNDDFLDLARRAADGADVEVVTAGSLYSGRIVFACLDLGAWQPQPDDSVERVLALSNGHDGTRGVRAATSSVRVVCANTEAHVLGKARSVHHRPNVRQLAERLVREVAEGRESAERLNRADAALTARPMSEVDRVAFYAEVYSLLAPPPSPKAAADRRERWERSRARRVAQWERAAAVESASAAERGWDTSTAWVALQGVTRWGSHERRVRKDRAPWRRGESLLGIGTGHAAASAARVVLGGAAR